MSKKKKKKSFFRKVLIVFLLLLCGSAIFTFYNFYQKVFSPNVSLEKQKTAYLYIPTDASFNDVMRILGEKHFLLKTASFEWVAELLKYKQNVHPGKYQIRAGMNNKELVLLLRSGKQLPVKLIFNTVRTKEQLAGKVSKQIEADSVSILKLLNDEIFLKTYHLTADAALALFIPNTYQFYWNTSAEQFLNRMFKEHEQFWTDNKNEKAKEMGLNPIQVAILASIVEQETKRDNEKEMIAGVYMNRLKKSMKLQADPTLVYALGDFTIKRVLDGYKDIDSPYNTYMYAGLPPGPICLPSIVSLNAVLNYRKHDYLYFCAKEDFSGYHNFASTYTQHLVNARKFQKGLNQRNIR